MRSHPGVFISYRRDTGSHLAGRISDFLADQGFDPFLDVDGLGGGHFDEQILREIEHRPHFVLICTRGCLDRCASERDWVRLEIAHAIRLGRNIVPVRDSAFHWPERATLPIEIAEVCTHHAFEYSHTHWKSTKQGLVERLELSPGRIADIMRRRPLIDEVLGDVSEDRSPDALDRQGCEANAAGDFAVALIRFRESLEIRRQRAHRSGAVADLRLVASSLDQVAQLEDFAGDPDSAMAHRLEALSIRRSIAGDSSSEHLREVASSLHGIGVVELSRRNPDQALKRFREAVKIRRSADRRTTTCESDIQLARSFMCIGDIERDAGAADSALVSYADALELCRRTVGVSFDSVTVGAFCSCLESIAAIELSQKYVERPLERLRESLSARRRLSTEVNSSAAIGRLCDTLELLAEAEFAVRSADAALQGYAESLDRRRDMARSMNTADCVMAIAASLCKAARVELAVGSSAAALEHQRESLDWLRLLPALCGVPAELHCAVNNGDQPIPLVVRITHILQQHVALAPVELVPAIIEVTSGLMSEILMRNLSGLPNTDVLIRTSESLMILRHHSARLKELLRESASRVRGAAGGTHEHVGELQAKLEVERLLLQISRMSSDLRDVAGRPTRRIDRHG